MPRYPIHEHFATFQGEGVNVGTRAYFIRLYGCDVRCSFCDSAGTWHRDFKPDNLLQLSAEETADLVTLPIRSLVVITGGEPALHDLTPLCSALHQRGAYRLAIETAGHQPLPRLFDHVALSPKTKFGAQPLPDNVVMASEFKIIVEDEGDIIDGIKAIAAHRRPGTPVWLHPEWSRAQDPKVLHTIRDAVLNGERYLPDPNSLRAGYQLHKLYAADEMSGAARPPVPLGGRRGPLPPSSR